MTEINKNTRTSQSMDALSFDEEFLQNTQLQVETDGFNLRRAQSKLVAKKITTVGNDTYVSIAPIGTAQSDAKWQVKKISISGSDMVTTWADGDALFDNVATDLTSLTFI